MATNALTKLTSSRLLFVVVKSSMADEYVGSSDGPGAKSAGSGA